MGGLPDLLFIIDTNKEAIAVEEARRLGIPVIAVVDSNSDPTGIRFPIPGNDDALRAIEMYCDLISSAVLDGLQAEMKASGIDIGAAAEPPSEAVAVTVGAEAGAEAVVAAEAGAAAAAGAPAGAEPTPADVAAKDEGEAKPSDRKGGGGRRRREKTA
jgi:small subunit ribosomal protein S2